MEIIKSVPPGGSWKDIPKHIADKSARLRQIRASGGRTTYYGRLRNDLPSYTISTYFNRPGNGTFVHPYQDRMISIREAARLQSFRDSYRFLGSTTSMYKQIGNAVPPLLALAIGLGIRRGCVADLFAGAGGLSEGLTNAGHSVIFASDINPHMCRTHQYNHPSTSVTCTDIAIDGETEKIADSIDNALAGKGLRMIAGGPPCQGFSTAGKWNSQDTRNTLFLPFIDVVGRLMPDYVLIENVPGLKWMQNGAVLDEMLSLLSNLEYDSTVNHIRAEGYGVPQRRRRVIILASRTGNPLSVPDPHFCSIERGGRMQDVEGSSTHAFPITVGEAISDLPSLPAGGGTHISQYCQEALLSDFQLLMREHLSWPEFLAKRAQQD
ncbi:MAG: DNA (cytosine-5-)-methyltransferase [Candidatus Thorarchaeota archaeon]